MRRPARAPLGTRAANPGAARAEDAFLGEKDQPERRQLEAGGAIACDDAEPLAAPKGRAGPGLEVVLGQDAAEADGLLVVVYDEAHREALGSPAANLSGPLLEAALEAAHPPR